MEYSCKKCKKKFEVNPNFPDNDMCKECYLKWKDKALKCKGCGTDIDWHNYHWHNRLCEACFELPFTNPN